VFQVVQRHVTSRDHETSKRRLKTSLSGVFDADWCVIRAVLGYY